MTNIEAFEKMVDTRKTIYLSRPTNGNFRDLIAAMKLLLQAYCEEAQKATQQASQISNKICELAFNHIGKK